MVPGGGQYRVLGLGRPRGQSSVMSRPRSRAMSGSCSSSDSLSSMLRCLSSVCLIDGGPIGTNAAWTIGSLEDHEMASSE